jgi:hypothetical protein
VQISDLTDRDPSDRPSRPKSTQELDLGHFMLRFYGLDDMAVFDGVLKGKSSGLLEAMTLTKLEV